MSTSTITFVKALKGGIIAGVIGATLNSIWSFIAQSMGSVPPPGFPIAIILSSIFPVLIGSVLYFFLEKYTAKGQLIFTIIGVLFTVVSFYPTITSSTLPDGTVVGEGFTLLTLPMHIISGALAIWGIPKFSK